MARRDFRLFLGGQATSVYGSTVTAIAIPMVAVTEANATPIEVGLLSASGALPMVLFGLVVATWADRIRRKRVALIVCDLTACGAVAFAAVVVVVRGASVILLICVTFLIGLVMVAIEALYFTHLRSIVPDDEIMRARARLQGAEQVSGVIGRATASPIAIVGSAVVLLLDAITYLVSALTLMLLRQPERPKEGRGERFNVAAVFRGFTVLRELPFLGWLTALLTIQATAVAAITALTAIFALTVVGVAPQWYSLLFLTASAAAISGTVVTDRFLVSRDPRLVAVVGFSGSAVAAALMPFAGGPLPLAVTILACAVGLPSFFTSVSNIGVTAFVTLAVPEEKLGRFITSIKLVTSLAAMGGAVAGGATGEVIGVRGALWAASGLAVASLLFLPPIIRILKDRQHGSQHDADSATVPASDADGAPTSKVSHEPGSAGC